MAASNLPHVINLSNSIIGVTILAMPFCFKQCGILLGAVLLFFCTWLTLVSCRLLMKAGVTSRRRSYGFLAYYTYGAPGKLAVEIGMIGLQLGTLIAQVVIIGDLGPAIVSKYLGLENNGNLRMGLICFLCLCVGLPLGLLKNLNTVSRASTLCILFYGLFTVYVFSLSIPNLIAGEWINKVNFWRSDGLFKCLPIFSFAFGCQTQLFIMYDNLPEPSLKSVNNIVQSAVNMCTVSYLLTGFFGYIAFHNKDIGGDIVTDFEVSVASDILKLGFVISIAVTFPLIIFPCRGSLYTLLFPQKQKHSDDLEKRPVIPELHFKVLTFLIVVGSMTTGILVPNVEFVLAMNGATMGTLICYIFPAVFFLRVMTGSSEGKQIAQAVLIFGCLIMVLCTLTTLNAQEQVHAVEVLERDNSLNQDVQAPSDKEKPLQPPVMDTKDKHITKDIPPDKVDTGRDKVDTVVESKDEKSNDKDKRVEPPNPREPSENNNPDKEVGVKKTLDKPKVDSELDNKKVDKSVEKKADQVLEGQDQLQKAPVMDKEQDQVKDEGNDERRGDNEGKDKDVKEESVNKKEEEKAEETKNKKQEEIINELEKQREEQRELIEEQKEILAQLKEHEQEHKQIDAEKQQANVGGQKVLNPQTVQAKQDVGQKFVANQQGVAQAMGGVQQQQQPIGGVQQQNVAQPMGGVQQQNVAQPMGGVQQQNVAQPMGGVQQQNVAQPMGGVQQQGVAQPMGGIQQQQPIGGVQQQGVAQPMGGVQQQGIGQPIEGVQQQPMGGVQQQQQPMGGVQQQPMGGVQQQPMGGVQQQPMGGVQQQPMGGVQQQPMGGVQQQPMGGVQQQPMGGVQQQPMGGVQQQPMGGVQQQPMGGVRQQKPMGGVQQQQKPVGGVQQQQPIGGLKQQAVVDQNIGNIKQVPGKIKSDKTQQAREHIDTLKEPGKLADQVDKAANVPKQENELNKEVPIKKKSSKHSKKERKEENRHRRDIADDKDLENDLLDDVVKPKQPNEEMRRKKLSIDKDMDINDLINNIDSVHDLSLVRGRSLKSILRKRS
ncbi:putative sodium-coupled neutral amino acid transporter 10 isoform X2 [Argopecten irradians]